MTQFCYFPDFLSTEPSWIIDFYNYLVHLKQKIQIEKIICIDEGNPSKFEQFEFIVDNI